MQLFATISTLYHQCTAHERMHTQSTTEEGPREEVVEMDVSRAKFVASSKKQRKK